MQHFVIKPDLTVWENMPMTLSDIAEAVGVPVVLISRHLAPGEDVHNTYGVDLGIDRSALASAFHDQSAKAATVIPNLALHPELSQWSSAFVARDLRFMVGLPLYNSANRFTGSISVVASQKHVAEMGIPIALLKMLGTQFVTNLA
jgi:hypothetical protein